MQGLRASRPQSKGISAAVIMYTRGASAALLRGAAARARARGGSACMCLSAKYKSAAAAFEGDKSTVDDSNAGQGSQLRTHTCIKRRCHAVGKKGDPQHLWGEARGGAGLART